MIQVGSRRSDVEKGAKRALPKLEAAIDGSRDHARQFTVRYRVGTTVVWGQVKIFYGYGRGDADRPNLVSRGQMPILRGFG